MKKTLWYSTAVAVLVVAAVAVVYAQDEIPIRDPIPWWKFTGKNIKGDAASRVVIGDVTQKVVETGSGSYGTTAAGLLTISASTSMSNLTWATVSLGTNWITGASKQIAAISGSNVVCLITYTNTALASATGTVYWAVGQ